MDKYWESIDVIVFKVRDNGKIINKPVYLCVGLKSNGLKEVLGMWVGKSESSFPQSSTQEWYHKSYWKPQRKNQKVHQIKAFTPNRWGSEEDSIPISNGDWEKMDTANSKLGIDYEPIFTYIWKQNTDIREISESCFLIYTK